MRPCPCLPGHHRVRRVRAAFAQQLPGFSFTQEQDKMEYRTMDLPPRVLDHADPDSRSRFNVLVDRKTNASIVAIPETSGQLRAAYIRSGGEHASMRTVDDYVRDLKASFPALNEVGGGRCSGLGQALAGHVTGRR